MHGTLIGLLLLAQPVILQRMSVPAEVDAAARQGLKTLPRLVVPQNARQLGFDFPEQAPKFAFVWSDDRFLSLQPLDVTQVGNRVRIEDLGRHRCQSQRQHLRNVAHAGSDEQAANVLVIHFCGVRLDDRRWQSLDMPRGADTNITCA